MILSDEIRAILLGLEIDREKVRIPGTLPRKTYLQVNEILESAGGKWSRKEKAHLFETDPRGAIERYLAEGQVYTTKEEKKDTGWFPTPPDLAKTLAYQADVHPGHRVLEPSAGEGALVRAVLELEPKAQVTAIEISAERARKMASFCHHILVQDFLDYRAPKVRFDRVIMNPPFAKSAAILHVRHAISMLRPKGRLVAVMPEGADCSVFGAHDWIAEALPDGSFKESGTGVHVKVLRLVKEG